MGREVIGDDTSALVVAGGVKKNGIFSFKKKNVLCETSTVSNRYGIYNYFVNGVTA